MTGSPAPGLSASRCVRLRDDQGGRTFLTIGARCMALSRPECRNDSVACTLARICRKSFDALARHAGMGEVGVQAAFARFHEYFAGRDELHAVRTEIAEAQAQTAPRAERPDGPPAGQAKGLDLARAAAAVRIAVFKLQHASRPDRFVQRVDHAGFRLVPALRHEHALTFG